MRKWGKMGIIGTGNIQSEGTCSVEIISPMSRRKYEGDFTFTRRKLDTFGLVSQLLNSMTQGSEIVDRTISAHLRAIAELTFVIKDSPPWWDEIKELADVGVILAVHNRYLDWLQDPFRSEWAEDTSGDA